MSIAEVISGARRWHVEQGDALDALRSMPSESVHCCVTSPPYWGLRDYGVESQIGLERTPDEYVARMVAVFREVRRVLRDDGTLWLNIGDSYATGGTRQTGRRDELPEYLERRAREYGTGTIKAIATPTTRTNIKIESCKPKDLVGIPWMVAFALRADGWYLRSDIIWHKPNPMPESVTDRPTKAHEYLFLLAKSGTYYYDAKAIADASVSGANGSSFTRGKTFTASNALAAVGKGERGDDSITRNRRTVWTVPSHPFAEAHFATFPPALIEPCIMAGCPVGGIVLDQFNGAGTAGLVATRLQRRYVGIELNPEYVAMSERRITGDAPLLNWVAK